MSPVWPVFFLLCPSIQFVSSLTLDSPELHVKYGGQALNALVHLLKFFESDTNDLNLDGLYGLRIAQGQLNALQENLTNAQNSDITDRNHFVLSLSTQIERIANQSLTALASTATAYLQRFAALTSKAFAIDYEVRPINTHLIEHGSRTAEFDEEKSDACFAELLGSSEQKDSKACSISKVCWTMNTVPLSKDYRLTHQLLWFLAAKNIGCLDNRPTSTNANKNFRFLEDRFCANIYEDAQANYAIDDNQDLFLEQILLCSIIGYEDFLRVDWFKRILTWQDSQYGCFGDNWEAAMSTEKTKRHLLVEQEMSNGCLSHKSGLAAGVLAAYSRALLQ